MASRAGIHGDPIGDIKHDLRERSTYRNEDIDLEKSGDNYILSDFSKGTTSGEVYSYYKELISKVYHRGKSTITTAEVVFTMPEDLTEGREEEFFQSSAKFATDYFFDGDTSRILLAVVHKDEGGAHHMHFQFVFPEIENKSFITAKDKFVDRIDDVETDIGIELSDAQKAQLVRAIVGYERNSEINNAIHQVSDALTIDRDQARKVFLRLKRTEKEKYEKKLLSKDEYLTKEVFETFHSEYQKWIDEHGPQCTVYKGGGTISIPVAQLKQMTKETGATLDHGLTPKELGEMILLREKEHVRDSWSRGVTWNKDGGDKTWKR